MSLRSPTEDENAEFVMPARIAGIQVRKDASGDIHVNLDSSTPCWNDAIEGTLLELAESASARIFEGDLEGREGFGICDPKINFVFLAAFVVHLFFWLRLRRRAR